MAVDRVALASAASSGERVDASLDTTFGHAPAVYVATRRRMSMNGWTTLLVFLPPALLLFTIFVALPMVEAGWYSFFNWNGFGRPEKFVGLKNYAYVASNPAFTRALINNGLIIVASLLVQLPLALGVALLIAGRMTGAVWFRMIFFLPYILADVAAGLIWRFMFDGQIGLPAIVTSLFGLQPFYLLASTDWAFTAVLIVILWKYFGFHMMLYIAGLQSLDKSLLEAAEMDGASAVQRFWHITLPLLRPYLLVAFLLRLIFEFRSFDNVYVMTSGGPANATMVLSMYTYLASFVRFDLSLGAASSWMMLLISLIMCGCFIALVRRRDAN